MNLVSTIAILIFTIPRKRDEEFKLLIREIGILIDARANTTEVILKAELASKEDIKDMATKQDISRLEEKTDETKLLQKQIDELKKRLDQIEDELASVKSRN